ncbi:hypothetical protein BJ878DRAFT_97109 [Calycina marina]|uniref:Uncharacterized protein n=1 Tax=Calycina marina TaxID=1763456 RepID=A0A9P7Z287_9HELO|nr:hypothetical protein BJ878DRAFT_97109 [Calycina marina]
MLTQTGQSRCCCTTPLQHHPTNGNMHLPPYLLKLPRRPYKPSQTQLLPQILFVATTPIRHAVPPHLVPACPSPISLSIPSTPSTSSQRRTHADIASHPRPSPIPSSKSRHTLGESGKPSLRMHTSTIGCKARLSPIFEKRGVMKIVWMIERSRPFGLLVARATRKIKFSHIFLWERFSGCLILSHVLMCACRRVLRANFECCVSGKMDTILAFSQECSFWYWFSVKVIPVLYTYTNSISP